MSRMTNVHIGTLQLVLKTVERCNLACDYCYFFFGGDESYRRRPPVISLDTVREVASFIREGCVDLAIPRVEVVFHGGEPMLQKPRDFVSTCEIFEHSLKEATVPFSFSMQTNGTLISSEWIDAIRKHEVNVSISIDPDKTHHDRHRVDKRGRGTYDLIAKNVPTFRDLGTSGVLSVLAPKLDYRDVIAQFVDHFGFRNVGFLLPDCNRDTGIPGGSAIDYGLALCQIFDVALDRSDVHIREVERILRRFDVVKRNGPPAHRAPTRAGSTQRYLHNQAIVVHSDGEVDMDDTYIPAQAWRGHIKSAHVTKTTLRKWLDQPLYRELDDIYANTPTACKSCMWRTICNGGDVENRFSSENGFDNPSVYCEGLKVFYAHVVRRLYEGGYPKSGIADRLNLDVQERQNVYAA